MPLQWSPISSLASFLPQRHFRYHLFTLPIITLSCHYFPHPASLWSHLWGVAPTFHATFATKNFAGGEKSGLAYKVDKNLLRPKKRGCSFDPKGSKVAGSNGSLRCKANEFD